MLDDVFRWSVRADLIGEVLGVPRGVHLESSELEGSEVHARGSPVNGQISENPPHERTHLEAVPGEAAGEDDILSEFAAKEVDDVVPVGRDHAAFSSRLRP